MVTRTLLVGIVVATVSLVLAPGVLADNGSVRIEKILDASELAATEGIDVISTSLSNRPRSIDGDIKVGSRVGVRQHTVVADDASYYTSIRRSKGKRLLGSHGYNADQGYWATPSTMFEDARSLSLIQQDLLTPTTAITGLDGRWPYSTFTPESAAQDDTNYPWYLTRTTLLPYNLAWRHVPVSDYREQRGRDGTRIITGRLDAGTEPDTDTCAVSDLRIVIDSQDRLRESSWTSSCPHRGVRSSTRHQSTASYGPQDPKPATSPSVAQATLISGT